MIEDGGMLYLVEEQLFNWTIDTHLQWFDDFELKGCSLAMQLLKSVLLPCMDFFD